MSATQAKLAVFLTFTGNAEAALNYYAEHLPGAHINSLVLYEKDNPNGDEGKVLNGTLSFAGQEIMFMDFKIDTPAPPFSWATSLYIDCSTEAEFDQIFAALAAEGSVMMGPEPVLQFRKVAWVTDKFGVTWQPVWA